MISPITHFHIFCGLGGGARGFNLGQARVGSAQARFVCLGGIDSDGAWDGFPPELVQAFAAMMRGCIPQIAQVLANGLQDMEQRRETGEKSQ